MVCLSIFCFYEKVEGKIFSLSCTTLFPWNFMGVSKTTIIGDNYGAVHSMFIFNFFQISCLEARPIRAFYFISPP